MKLQEIVFTGQHRCPKGPLGRIVGERMVVQHEPETRWTIAMLAIKPADTLLEIGFGAGKAIELAASQAIDGYVAGIDLSATMVRAAKRRNARAVKAGNVNLLQGNVASLPFADQQFDKVWSIHTLYFWWNSLASLREIYRVLKLNGVVMLTLSPGEVDSSDRTIPLILQEQVMPRMKQVGFTSVTLEQGPTSRQFATVALLGKKEILSSRS